MTNAPVAQEVRAPETEMETRHLPGAFYSTAGLGGTVLARQAAVRSDQSGIHTVAYRGDAYFWSTLYIYIGIYECSTTGVLAEITTGVVSAISPFPLRCSTFCGATWKGDGINHRHGSHGIVSCLFSLTLVGYWPG